MRIISGKHRGRKLADFAGEEIRPTADRVKECLFNILSMRVLGARVLDLFCGSGALGLECISRGAEEVHFNDVSKESLAVLKKNLSAIGEEATAIIFNRDFAACLNMAEGEYGIIFLDPPYASDCGKRALEIIAKRGLLTEGGVAVYERDRPFEEQVEGLKKTDERRYGKTYLTFFEKEN